MIRRRRLLATGLLCAVALLLAGAGTRRYWQPIVSRLVLCRTVEDRLEQYGGAVDARLRLAFERAGVGYPPRRLALVALKGERQLELWAEESDRWKLVKTYHILGQSGGPGPKLREGDRQVPEGVYRVEALNPNSSYHLSLKLNYPNEFDLARAAEDGRSKPGSDIFIHGGSASIGCLAMGDPAAEELFVLAARARPVDVEVVIAPAEMRNGEAAAPPPGAPDWTGDLYEAIERALARYVSAR